MEDHDSPSMSAVPSPPREAAPLSLAERCRELHLKALRSYSHPNQEEQLILLRNELVRESEAIASELDRVAGEMRKEGALDYGDGADRIAGSTAIAWADTLSGRRS